jgi:PAS domain S-box-containing protein
MPNSQAEVAPPRQLLRQALFWLAIALILGAGFLSFRSFEALSGVQQLINHTLTVLNTIDELTGALADAETGQRGYLLTGDSKYLEPYQAAVTKIPGILGLLQHLTMDNPSQQHRLETLRPSVDHELGILADSIKTGPDRPVDDRPMLDQARKVMDRIRGTAAAMRDEESRLYRTRSEEAARQARDTAMTFAAAVLLSVVTMGLVFYRVIVEVRRRRHAEQALQELNRGLEARVQVRTTELVEANSRLQGEISERRRIAEAYRETNETLGAVIEATPFAIICLDPAKRVLIWNRAAESMFGYRAVEIVGEVYPLVPDEERAAFTQLYDRAAAGEVLRDIPALRRRKDGTLIEISFAGAPLYDEAGGLRGVIYMLEDVTERNSSQRQLRQAQKMEAIGQLTGGIAHDFNNLLTVILSSLDLMEEIRSLPSDAPPLLNTARNATLRGAELTRRLLAFARKQTLAPELLDINRLLPDLTNLLRRTLGEHIAIDAVTQPDLWSAVADPSQLENAIVNLAVNARDAMPGGGRLLIETANVQLDDHYAAQHAEVKAGDYVMVAVTDTGTGMTREVAERAFEPFYTTKAVGHGTGLGLSMVYGFVKQSGGHIKIYTEPQHGTTIKLYLPRGGAVSDRDADGSAASPEALPTGKEAILVVEDSPDVRSLAVLILGQLGYQIYEAEHGPAALAVLNKPLKIDLLFTDVVMPEGMTGYELAEAALRLRPGLKVLFASGYSEAFMRSDSVRSGRSLTSPERLITKPYRKKDLAVRIRAVLDGEPA